MTEDLESGTVRNTAVKANRDSDHSVRMLDVEMSDPSDIQSVQLVSIGGVDYHPLPGAKIMVAQVGNAWKMAIVLDDGIEPAAAPGEKWIYSQTTAGALAALIKMRNDATMELNGDTDFAVAYDDMKAAFDTLKGDLNTFVTAYNAHTGHSTGAAPPPAVPSAADMAAAKVDTVKLP